MNAIDEDILVSLTDVGINLDDRSVLSGITLDIRRGDFIAVTGPNGGGKTTLMRIILKLLRPTTGTVEYRGEAALADFGIGYLPQKNKIDSRFPITVADTVALGLLGNPAVDKAEKARRVEEALATVGLTPHADSPIGRLSGGQLQRTLLARAIIGRPSMLVLDEPLSYLDKHFESQVYDVIRTLASHTTVILVSHDISTIAQMANRHIIVNHTLHFCSSSNHFLHYNCCDHEECSSEFSKFAARNHHHNH